MPDQIVSKGIIELHGGTITATSEGLGKGSCFSVELPVASIEMSAVANSGISVATIETSPMDLQVSQSKTTDSPFSSSMLRLAGGVDRVKVNPEAALINTIEPTFIRSASLKFMKSLGQSNSFNKKVDDEFQLKVNKVADEKDDEIPFNNMKQGRVLIVDDVPMNRKMLKRLLIARFDECDEAENGQQAVDMAKSAMALGLCYDIITMDYQMPIMDGVTATRSIRKLGYKGRIIGVTGNAFQEDVDSFIRSGANIVLTKPLSKASLEEYLIFMQ